MARPELGEVDPDNYDEKDPDASPWTIDGQRVTRDEMDKAFDADTPGIYGYGLDAFFN